MLELSSHNVCIVGSGEFLPHLSPNHSKKLEGEEEEKEGEKEQESKEGKEREDKKKEATAAIWHNDKNDRFKTAGCNHTSATSTRAHSLMWNWGWILHIWK